jgi:hypothetical protein
VSLHQLFKNGEWSCEPNEFALASIFAIAVMRSKALVLVLILALTAIVRPVPELDSGFWFVLDDVPLTVPASDEQLFEIISPIDDYSMSESDWMALDGCSETTDISNLVPDDTLQARQDHFCPSRPPEAGSSTADGEDTDPSGDSMTDPLAEQFDLEFHDNSLKADNEPRRRLFSLPQDYQDDRCIEFGPIQYAVCSSGDYRDEAKSLAYNFHPVQTYRLNRCTFSELDLFLFFPHTRVIPYSFICFRTQMCSCIECRTSRGKVNAYETRTNSVQSIQHLFPPWQDLVLHGILRDWGCTNRGRMRRGNVASGSTGWFFVSLALMKMAYEFEFGWNPCSFPVPPFFLLWFNLRLG